MPFRLPPVVLRIEFQPGKMVFLRVNFIYSNEIKQVKQAADNERTVLCSTQYEIPTFFWVS